MKNEPVLQKAAREEDLKLFREAIRRINRNRTRRGEPCARYVLELGDYTLCTPDMRGVIKTRRLIRRLDPRKGMDALSKVLGGASGACFLSMLIFGCCLDGPNWELAFAISMASGIIGGAMYKLAEFAHDRA